MTNIDVYNNQSTNKHNNQSTYGLNNYFQKQTL